MKLYCYPGAASLAVHIALREVEADFYLERVNLHTKQVEDSSDYLKVSPQGYVPVLEFQDGSGHTETACLIALARRARREPAADRRNGFRTSHGRAALALLWGNGTAQVFQSMAVVRGCPGVLSRPDARDSLETLL